MRAGDIVVWSERPSRPAVVEHVAAAVGEAVVRFVDGTRRSVRLGELHQSGMQLVSRPVRRSIPGT